MTVLLVLAMFIGFLLIDFFMSKGKQPVFATEKAVRRDNSMPRLLPNVVGGFKVPENLRYHPGHTWALSESPNLVRVGIDDFATKLTGKVDGISLPQRGQWVRQGQKILSMTRNGVTVDMLSPIEGSIADVNDAVARDPEVARQDPYGEGWMVTVQSPDQKTNFKNLMGGALARWWTEESSGRLMKRIPNVMGNLALAQDGGLASDDLGNQIPAEQWDKVAREFFLS